MRGILANTLKRQARDASLLRLENGARTADDFHELVDMYDKLDSNRERRERYNEINQGDYLVQYKGSKKNGFMLTYADRASDEEPPDDDTEVKQENTSEDKLEDKPENIGAMDKYYQKKESSKNYTYSEGAVIPAPLSHPYWRELLRGDFINFIYDNAQEMWQIVGDWQVGRLLKDTLTDKQKEAIFLFAVRLANTEQIGCYTDKSSRAVRRLIADGLKNIRAANWLK